MNLEETLEDIAYERSGGGLDPGRFLDLNLDLTSIQFASGPPTTECDAGQWYQRPHARTQDQLGLIFRPCRVEVVNSVANELRVAQQRIFRYCRGNQS